MENYIWIGFALLVGLVFQVCSVATYSIPRPFNGAALDLARKLFPAGSLRVKLGSIAFATLAFLLGLGLFVGPLVVMAILMAKAMAASDHDPKQVAGTFVITLLIKTFLIPLIKAAVVSVGGKVFFRLLRTGSLKNTDKPTTEAK